MYRTLLSLYPRRFRERVGESMEQTFNDLCRERKDAGENVVGFVLWTFADTFVGIIKETLQSMTRKTKVFGSTILALGGAFAVLGTVWWANGPDDNTWLYVFCAWLILYSGWEVYVAWKRKEKDQ
jgi:hypothetical protein